jgi:hypothetical protein
MNIPKVDTTSYSPLTSSEIPEKRETLWENVQSTALSILQFIETIFWKYVEEANYFTQHVFAVITTACSELNAKLSPVIAKLGILSLINCFFSLKALPSTVESLIDHIKSRDGEGAAFAALSLIVAPFDILDSVTSTIGALTAFGAIPTIAFFSLIGLPLAIGLVGYSAFKGLYDIIRSSIQMTKFPRTIGDGTLEQFKSYLKSEIGVTAQEKEELKTKFASLKTDASETEYTDAIKREIKVIKDRKRNILERHTDVKVCNIMKNLKKHLKSHPTDVNTANFALHDMKTIISRKITWGSVELTNNLAYIATMASSLIFPISALAIPIVGGIRAAVAIGKHHYMHVLLDHGLHFPDFAKS